MKLELVDAIVILLAILLLAAYAKLGTPAFLYAVVLLIAAEIFVHLFFREKREVKQPESMP